MTQKQLKSINDATAAPTKFFAYFCDQDCLKIGEGKLKTDVNGKTTGVMVREDRGATELRAAEAAAWATQGRQCPVAWIIVRGTASSPSSSSPIPHRPAARATSPRRSSAKSSTSARRSI